MQDISIRTAVAMQNFVRPPPRGAGPDRRRVRGHPRPPRRRLRRPVRRRHRRQDQGRRRPGRREDPQGRSSLQHRLRNSSVPGLCLGALCVSWACSGCGAAPRVPRRRRPLRADHPRRLGLDERGRRRRRDPAGRRQVRVDDLIGAVPEGAKVGLRVYGNRVSGVARAEGCKDTNLETPVGPLDRDAFKAEVNALEGKGRTPIGRSLLKAPDDLGPSGDRTVILVSDGGDNCAPPPPCQAARQISKRGLKLSISVVGLQVNPRVRRQLKCIADAGGGTYVDASDPEALKRELLAAFARAFRAYEPSGTPVEGAPAEAARPCSATASTWTASGRARRSSTRSTSSPGRRCTPRRWRSRPAGWTAPPTSARADHAGGRGGLERGRRPRLRLPRPVREHQGPLGTRSEQVAGAGHRERPAARPLEVSPSRWRPATWRPWRSRSSSASRCSTPTRRPARRKEPGAPGQTPTREQADAERDAEAADEEEDEGSSVPLAAGAPGAIGLVLGLVGGYARHARQEEDVRLVAAIVVLLLAPAAASAQQSGRDPGRRRRLVRQRAADRARRLPRHAAPRRAAVLRDQARGRPEAPRHRPARRRGGRAGLRHRLGLLDRDRDAAARGRGARPRRRRHLRQHVGHSGRQQRKLDFVSEPVLAASGARDGTGNYRGPGIWYVSLYLSSTEEDPGPRRGPREPRRSRCRAPRSPTRARSRRPPRPLRRPSRTARRGRRRPVARRDRGDRARRACSSGLALGGGPPARRR